MYKKNFNIQFVDTDASKRIHYSSIFRYLEILDHEFLASIGYSYPRLFAEGFEMPRVHLDCMYLGSVEYADELEGQIAVAKIGNSSLTYAFEFMKAGQSVVKGTMTIVFITSKDGKKISIPDALKEELKNHMVLQTQE